MQRVSIHQWISKILLLFLDYVASRRFLHYIQVVRKKNRPSYIQRQRGESRTNSPIICLQMRQWSQLQFGQEPQQELSRSFCSCTSLESKFEHCLSQNMLYLTTSPMTPMPVTWKSSCLDLQHEVIIIHMSCDFQSVSVLWNYIVYINPKLFRNIQPSV